MTFTPEEMEQMAINSIRYYLNVQSKPTWTDEYIKATFPLAIKKIIEDSTIIESVKRVGVKSASQGNQSITFADNTEAFSINDSIKSLLPRPYIVGW
jgi:hypothetical protein